MATPDSTIVWIGRRYFEVGLAVSLDISTGPPKRASQELRWFNVSAGVRDSTDAGSHQ